jgi:hypothetical protein
MRDLTGLVYSHKKGSGFALALAPLIGEKSERRCKVSASGRHSKSEAWEGNGGSSDVQIAEHFQKIEQWKALKF